MAKLIWSTDEILRPAVTAYDDDVGRLFRLHEALGFVKAIASLEFDEQHLAAVHDHKGMLQLTWRRPPTPWVQDCFAKAWDVQCEPPENVEHRMLGQHTYCSRIVIGRTRHG